VHTYFIHMYINQSCFPRICRALFYLLYNVKTNCFSLQYSNILHFTFLFSLFVFVSAAGHYFRIFSVVHVYIISMHIFSVVHVYIISMHIFSVVHVNKISMYILPGTCIILDKKYNIANSSCHFRSYGSIWTGPSPKKYYMDLRSFPQCHELFAIYSRSNE
jgi:hypothetical protein